MGGQLTLAPSRQGVGQLIGMGGNQNMKFFFFGMLEGCSHQARIFGSLHGAKLNRGRFPWYHA